MDKEEIDELFEAIENEDYETLIRISETGIDYTDFLSGSDEEQLEMGDIVLKSIFAKIDNGDFEYFKSKIKSCSLQLRDFLLIEMQDYSKHFREYAIELVEGLEKLDIPLQSDKIVRLIEGIDAIDSSHSYTKKYLDGKAITELDTKDIVKLLDLINDIKYTKKIIEQREDILFELDSREVIELDEPKLTEIYLRKMKDKIPDFEIIYLIKSTNNVELIREAIDGTLGIELSSRDLVNLVKEEDDLIKEVLEGKLKNRVELNSYTIENLIVLLKDNEYIKNVLEGKIKLITELEKDNKVQILRRLHNTQLLKDCIEGKIELGFELDEYTIIDFITEANENDPDFTYIKSCIEGNIQLGFNLNKRMLMELIELIDTDEEHVYLKEIIEGKTKIFVKLDDYDLLQFINKIDRDSQNHEYAKECIREKYTNRNIITELLRDINDIEYTKQCISNDFELIYYFRPFEVKQFEISEWSEEYLRHIGSKNEEMLMRHGNDIKELIKSINNPNFIKECLEGRISILADVDKYSISRRGPIGRRNTPRITMLGDEYLISDSVSLIRKINDDEYTKLCIEGKIPLVVELNPQDKVQLILGLQDLELEYVTECIRNATEIGINTNYLIKNIINIPNAKQYAEVWLNNWQDLQLDGEALCSLIKITDNEIAHQINFDKLEEILLLKDASSIQSFLLDNVILKNMGQESADIESINMAIDSVYDTFLTSTLPYNFKLFEFFRYHENHDSENNHFYNDVNTEERDKIISGDLFRTLLESDNIQMRSFLELLHNGHIALTQNSSDDISKAILLEYRDILFSLAKSTEDIHFSKTQDYMQDLDRIRDYFNLGDNKDIGEALLERYFTGTELEYKVGDINLVESLLEVMNSKREEAHESNQMPFQLLEGDLIKGTSFKFVSDMLRNGIRSKEFLMRGNMNSDRTPLDTDFSEISEENLQKNSLAGILDSTYTKAYYGSTYFVIRKSDYEEDEVSYSCGSGANKTRYFRTGIGSTNISAIITAEWDDEYKYMLASNSFYIPVIDKNDGKVLFSIEDYEQIRQSMQGLSHFGMSEYTLDDSVYDSSIREQAEELRKNAEGKASTEEKRQAVVNFIREHIGREITTEMLGDISSRYLELIDTGSTGRGTNIPGDGDFDFMLKCSSKEEEEKMIAKIKTFLSGKDKGGTGPYAIRYTDVEVEGLDEPVEVDVTAEQKRLEVDYSSDLAIRDRLDSIRTQYGEEALRAVVDNIIVAKKVLKQEGVYKKVGSTGSTELGGFGGIGVENWILQNGGSFTKAMQTFLEHTVDEDGKEISFAEFKKRYPIYDFGQNHRFGSDRHDHYVEGLSEAGFKKMKELFRERLKDRDIKPHEIDILGDSIIDFTKRAEGYVFSDMSQIYSLIARLRTHEQRLEQQYRGEI